MKRALQTAPPNALLCRASLARALAVAAEHPILIALSGGGDSVALLHAMRDELGAGRLQAVVIDHGLRAESAEEARRAAAFAEGCGVAAQIITLHWENEKPSQANARRKRYVALCDAARSVGARVIATGHTTDDQAETVLMRAAAGASWRGLAGMRALGPAPVWPEGRDIFLARPLLKTRRADLRDDLRARGAAWIEDPSNANTIFTRVRARAALAELTQVGFDCARLTDLAARLRARADAEDAEAWARIQAHACFQGPEVSIPVDALDGTLGLRVLRALVAAAAGADSEPGEAQAQAARTALAAASAATLGGALLRQRRAFVTLSRDSGALQGRADGAAPPPPLTIAPSAPAVWDGRVLIGARRSVIAQAGNGPEPVLVIAGAAVPLAAAAAEGIVTAEWLLQSHVRRRLAPGELASKTGKNGEAFTAP